MQPLPYVKARITRLDSKRPLHSIYMLSIEPFGYAQLQILRKPESFYNTLAYTFALCTVFLYRMYTVYHIFVLYI